MALPTIEAIYIFTSGPLSTLLLSHIYTGRPPSPKTILPLYLAQATPRPSFFYAPSTSPPTLIHALHHDSLLFFGLTSTDADPLVVFEFLHRLTDALTAILGDPLLPNKLEGPTAQAQILLVLTEICDAGTISTTEPDALRDLVEGAGWVSKLLGGPSPSLSLGGISSGNGLGSSGSMAAKSEVAIPWRRANVKHTSNEMYVDILETLSVVLAPSGIPMAAFAHGSVVFTAKVSGVPDILLQLAATGGGTSVIGKALQMPVFHPCVRLARWAQRPGEVSFVPPDGKCVLMSYSVDLLGDTYLESLFTSSKKPKSPLQMPLSLSISKSTSSPNTFIITLHLTPTSLVPQSKLLAAPASRTTGSSVHPTLEAVLVRVPIPSGVRSLGDLQPSRGDSRWAPGSEVLEWRVPTSKDTGDSILRLRCTITGEEDEDDEPLVATEQKGRWDYDEFEGSGETKENSRDEKQKTKSGARKDWDALMPSSATVSFQVKGWLASGIKVEKLVIDTARSRGLGPGVQPYKGVKYLTASQDGVEIRC